MSLLPPADPQKLPLAAGGLPCGLLIGLPGLELGLQFSPESGIGPLLAPLLEGEEHPIAKLGIRFQAVRQTLLHNKRYLGI